MENEPINIVLNFENHKCSFVIPRFLLSEEYFEMCLSKNFTATDTITLEIESEFDPKIAEQVKKYIIHGIIDVDLDIENVEILKSFSEKYLFEDMIKICEKILELDKPYRIIFEDLTIVYKNEIRKNIYILRFSDSTVILAYFTKGKFEFIKSIEYYEQNGGNYSIEFKTDNEIKWKLSTIGIYPVNIDNFRLEMGQNVRIFIRQFEYWIN